MMTEPLRCNSRHFLQRSRFLKQMCCTWNNDQLLVATLEFRQSISVHTDYGLVIPSNDQKSGSPNSVEGVLRKIRSTSARNDCRSNLRKFGRRHERGARTRAGSEIANLKIPHVRSVDDP